MSKLQQPILHAYLQLLQQYSPNDITVKQIVATASISRSAFYTNYESKEQLHFVLKQLIHEEFLRCYAMSAKDIQSSITTLTLCQHVLMYRNYYQWAFKDAEEIQYLCAQLEKLLAKVYQDIDYAIFASYGTVGYLKKWSDDRFLTSPAEAAEKLLKIGFTNWSSTVLKF